MALRHNFQIYAANCYFMYTVYCILYIGGEKEGRIETCQEKIKFGLQERKKKIRKKGSRISKNGVTSFVGGGGGGRHVCVAQNIPTFRWMTDPRCLYTLRYTIGLGCLKCVCVFMCVYKIARNRAIRSCHPLLRVLLSVCVFYAINNKTRIGLYY